MTLLPVIEMASFKEQDIPKFFYLETRMDQEFAKDLAAGALDGVSGIGGNGEIEYEYFGSGRKDVSLVMPGKETVRLNKLSRVMYWNPHYMLSKNMAALQRVWSTDADGAVNRIARYLNELLGDRLEWDTGSLNGDHHERGSPPINNVQDFIKLVHSYLERRLVPGAQGKYGGSITWLPRAAKEAREVLKWSYDKWVRVLTSVGEMVHANYEAESEWVVKNRKLRVPRGSKIRIATKYERRLHQGIIDEYGLGRLYDVEFVDEAEWEKVKWDKFSGIVSRHAARHKAVVARGLGEADYVGDPKLGKELHKVGFKTMGQAKQAARVRRGQVRLDKLPRKMRKRLLDPRRKDLLHDKRMAEGRSDELLSQYGLKRGQRVSITAASGKVHTGTVQGFWYMDNGSPGVTLEMDPGHWAKQGRKRTPIAHYPITNLDANYRKESLGEANDGGDCYEAAVNYLMEHGTLGLGEAADAELDNLTALMDMKDALLRGDLRPNDAIKRAKAIGSAIGAFDKIWVETVLSTAAMLIEWEKIERRRPKGLHLRGKRGQQLFITKSARSDAPSNRPWQLSNGDDVKLRDGSKKFFMFGHNYQPSIRAAFIDAWEENGPLKVLDIAESLEEAERIKDFKRRIQAETARLMRSIPPGAKTVLLKDDDGTTIIHRGVRGDEDPGKPWQATGFLLNGTPYTHFNHESIRAAVQDAMVRKKNVRLLRAEALSEAFEYGLRLRPPGPGAVPKGFSALGTNPRFRHGTVSYDRKLTPAEVRNFELEPLFGQAGNAGALLALPRATTMRELTAFAVKVSREFPKLKKDLLDVVKDAKENVADGDDERQAAEFGHRGIAARLEGMAESLDERSFVLSDIPKDFRVVFDLGSSEDYGDAKAWKALAIGRFDNIRGISDTGLIEPQFLGVARNAELVMPGKAFASANKVTRILYDNPNYMLSKDAWALRRIFQSDTRNRERGMSHTLHNLFDYMLGAWKAQGLGRFADAVKYGNGHYQLAYLIAERGKKIDGVRGFIRAIRDALDHLPADWREERIRPLAKGTADWSDAEWAKWIVAAIKTTAMIYKNEGEWVVKGDSLTIPSGSTLRVLIGGDKDIPDAVWKRYIRLFGYSGKKPAVMFQDDIPKEERVPVNHPASFMGWEYALSERGYILGRLKDLGILSKYTVEFVKPAEFKAAQQDWWATREKGGVYKAPVGYAPAYESLAEAMRSVVSKGIYAALDGIRITPSFGGRLAGRGGMTAKARPSIVRRKLATAGWVKAPEYGKMAWTHDGLGRKPAFISVYDYAGVTRIEDIEGDIEEGVEEYLDEATTMPDSARTTFDSAPYANMRLLDVARLLQGASQQSNLSVSLITKLVDRLIHALEFTIYSIQGRPEGKRIGTMIRQAFNNLTDRIPEIALGERRDVLRLTTRLNEAVETLDLGPVEAPSRLEEARPPLPNEDIPRGEIRKTKIRGEGMVLVKVTSDRYPDTTYRVRRVDPETGEVYGSGMRRRVVHLLRLDQ